MLKSILLMPVNVFRFVMDPRVSPLRHLPPAQRFQVMCVLGLMWTTIFCLGAGAWLYYGQLVIFHVLVALGAMVTGMTFHSASKKAETYRDFPAMDGSARYDDVWGAAETRPESSPGQRA